MNRDTVFAVLCAAAFFLFVVYAVAPRWEIGP
jgi:hypothetical protein